MNVEIRTEADRSFLSGNIFSNFRYSVFAVQEYFGKQDW
jgi:hypothetical protein